MSQSQKVLVAGTGKSGMAAARLILKRGGDVVLYDGNESLDCKKLKEAFEEDARKHVSVVLGELKPADLKGVELCIISPGIPLTAPFVAVADGLKIPILGEIELAYQSARGKLAAITGTNGKTTATSLVGEMLRSHYTSVFVVGNIGDPYTAAALKTTDDSVTVAEVSSFQLETILDFKPEVSAILNITPDHLDRHGTMECYTRIKEAVTLNQTKKDWVVLNYDDKVLRELGENPMLKPQVVYFSSREELKEGFYLKQHKICYRHGGRETEVTDVRDMNLLGRHNYENAMAAAAVALHMGVPMEKIANTLREFQAVEHRIEFVLERSGVKYYNDSKGTNPDAAVQAIRAMPGPILLIAGGYDKRASYDQWVEEFSGRVKYLVLIGQTRDQIAECAKAHGFTEIMYAEDMAEAVQVCASYADMGDCVLLSPACASWGMFKNFEERGRVFKECVRSL